MIRQQHAGPCATGRARHEWGPEQKRVAGGSTSWYVAGCYHCPRLRVRQYTMRGNHIAGYETKPAPPPREWAVVRGSDHLAQVTTDTDWAAARAIARRLGYFGQPHRCSAALAGAQRFRFLGRGRDALVLTVVEMEVPQ